MLLRNFSNLKKIKELDITNSIYYPQNQFNDDIVLETKDNNIFLYQYCFESLTPVIKFYWFAWYDKSGKQIGQIDKIKDKNGKYYKKILPMGVKNSSCYLVAKKTDFSYDILKMKAYSNQLEIIGEIKIKNPSIITGIYLWRTEFLSNNEILLCFNILKNNEFNKRTNFTYYYNFNMEDLGIITKTNEVVIEDNNFEISPNPIKDYFKLEFKYSFSGKLELFNINGKIVIKKLYFNTKKTQIDISNFKKGMYFLVATDANGKQYREKIIKVQ